MKKAGSNEPAFPFKHDRLVFVKWAKLSVVIFPEKNKVFGSIFGVKSL